jgi:hypothetical protein
VKSAVARAVLLLALVASPLGDGASASAPDDGGARCQLARARAAERLRVDAPLCAHDWDCAPFEPQRFGCDLFLDRRTHAAPGTLATLDAACPVVLASAAACPALVGACERGRCTSRPPSGEGCDSAVSAVRTRASARTLCEHDSECELLALDGAWYAVPRDFREGAEREEFEVRDRCAGSEPFSEPDLRPRARCREGLCRMTGDATPLRGPRIDRACIRTVVDRQAAVRAIARKQGRVFTRFAVDPRGKVGDFWFPADTPGDLAGALSAAIGSCKVEPGLDGEGKPVPLSVALPLSFR